MKQSTPITESEVNTRIAHIEAKQVARRAESARHAYKMDIMMVAITLSAVLVLFVASTVRGDMAKQVYDFVTDLWPFIVALYVGRSIQRIFDYRSERRGL